MFELTPHAHAFREQFLARNELLDLSNSDPALADVYREPLDQAALLLSILEDSAQDSLYDAATSREPDDRAYQRRLIESLRDTSAYRDGLVTEEQLRARLASLPPFEDYPESDKAFATAYVIGKFLANYGLAVITGNSDSNSVRRDETVHIESDKPPLPDPAEHEVIDPRKIQIDIYNGDSTLIINGQTDNAIFLGRSFVSGRHTATEEKLIVDLRIRALKLFAENPDKEYVASEIWGALMPDEPYKTSLFYRYIGDFFMNELQFNGVPIVENRKQGSEASKIRYFKLGDWLPNIQIHEEASDAEQQISVFLLPNDAVIGGKVGLLAHRLVQASPDKPFTDADLRTSGIYSVEELDKLKGVGHILSNLVSSLRSSLKNAEAYDLYTIHKVLSDEPKSSSRSRYSYWMEELSKVADPGAPKNPGNTNPERDTQLRRIRAIGAYIAARGSLLARLGIKVLPDEVALGTVSGTTETPNVLSAVDLQTSQDMLRQILQDPEKLNSLLDQIGPDEASLPLIDYLFDRLSDTKSQKLFIAALRAHVDRIEITRFQNDPMPVISKVIFNVMGQGTIAVSPNELATKSSMAFMPSIDQEAGGIPLTILERTPGNNAKRTSSLGAYMLAEPLAESDPHIAERALLYREVPAIIYATMEVIRSQLPQLNKPDGVSTPELLTILPQLAGAQVGERIIDRSRPEDMWRIGDILEAAVAVNPLTGKAFSHKELYPLVDRMIGVTVSKYAKDARDKKHS